MYSCILFGNDFMVFVSCGFFMLVVICCFFEGEGFKDGVEKGVYNVININ